MTLQKVHQVILEATVGGEAGDIAIDDISLISGPCPASGNKTEAAENPRQDVCACNMEQFSWLDLVCS